MTVKKGHIYHMLGHKMRVTTVKGTDWVTNTTGEKRRVFLTCAPHCCTTPFHVKLEILEEDLEKIPMDKL